MAMLVGAAMWGLLIVECAHSKGLVTFQAADTIKAADKITGVESPKVADKVEIGTKSNQSTIKTSVGGNQTNDSELMKAYIEANRSAQERLINAQAASDRRFMMMLKIFIGSLFTLIFKYELQIRKINNRLLDARDKEDEKDEERLDKALKLKKEEAV